MTTQRKTDYRRDAINRYQMQLPWSPGKTMSSDQVADILGCSRHTVIAMCESGELQAYQLRKIAKSPWRIFSDSVAKHLEGIVDDNALQTLDAPAKRGNSGSVQSARPVASASRRL